MNDHDQVESVIEDPANIKIKVEKDNEKPTKNSQPSK